jgi:hypothetical protein
MGFTIQNEAEYVAYFIREGCGNMVYICDRAHAAVWAVANYRLLLRSSKGGNAETLLC